MNRILSIKTGTRLGIAIAGAALCLVAALGFPSCSDMNDNYEVFLKDGETIYPGKADSLKTFSGNYRIMLQWLLVSDPTIARARIFWNTKQDSMEIAIQRTLGVDTIRVIIPNLDERTYTFNIFTFDKAGNKSVSSEVAGVAYGDIYRGSLLNRAYSKVAVTSGKLVITWKAAQKQSIGDELVYTDNTGTEKTVLVPVTETTTTLSDYQTGTSFKYRSGYLPEVTAIDTFYTGFITVTPP